MYDYAGKCRHIPTNSFKAPSKGFESETLVATTFYLLDFECLFYSCTRSVFCIAV